VFANLADLLNPMFLGFFAYFALTVFGGVSLLLIVGGLRDRSVFTREPEWLTLAGAILVVALLGSLDIWRYLAYAVPAAAILYALGPAREDWRLILPWTAMITVITQQPWGTMTDESYFTDWFPLYRAMWNIPEPPAFEFWPLWGVRFAIVAACVAGVWRLYKPTAFPSPQVSESGA
jgi:hypothetical protein